jgi:mannitol-1-phosphate/altronate dehydrogenase
MGCEECGCFEKVGQASSAFTMVDPINPYIALSTATSVCLGSGRFLRAVLVPALEAAGMPTVIFQTRGESFPKMMYGPRKAMGTYEVDTVEFDGCVTTTTHAVVAAGSCGTSQGLIDWELLPNYLPNLQIIGVGVTEAGLVTGSAAMRALASFLHSCSKLGLGPLSVINTDNMPGNGDKIRQFVTDPAMVANVVGSSSNRVDQDQEDFLDYLQQVYSF